MEHSKVLNDFFFQNDEQNDKISPMRFIVIVFMVKEKNNATTMFLKIFFVFTEP